MLRKYYSELFDDQIMYLFCKPIQEHIQIHGFTFLLHDGITIIYNVTVLWYGWYLKFDTNGERKEYFDGEL